MVKPSALHLSAQSLRLEMEPAVASVAVGAFLCCRWSGQQTELFQSKASKGRIPILHFLSAALCPACTLPQIIGMLRQ